MLLNFIKNHRLLFIHFIAMLLIAAAILIYFAAKNAIQFKKAEERFNVAGDIVRIEYSLFLENEAAAVTERQEDIKLLLDCIELARQSERTANPYIAGINVGPHITYTYADGSQRTYDYYLKISDNYTYPFKAFEEIPYIAEQLSAPAE